MTLFADATPLAAGPTRLRWTTAAADGHKVNGSIQFVVSGEAAQAWSPTAAAPIGEPGTESAKPVAAPAEWSDVEEPAGRRLVPILVSGAGSLFLLTLTGLLFFLATTRDPEEFDQTLEATTVRAALFLASLAAAMLMIEVIVWTRDVSVGGADGVFAALDTATGRAGLGRAILAFAALVAVQFTGGRGLGAVVLAVLAVVAGSTAGHPASFSPAISMPANAIHQVAAAVWAGGLVYLVLVCGTARTESSGADVRVRRTARVRRRGRRDHRSGRERRIADLAVSARSGGPDRDAIRATHPGKDGGPARARRIRGVSPVPPDAGARRRGR